MKDQYEFTQTQEFKDKIKNIVTGKRWYNNGEINVFVYEEDRPKGFVEGMLPTKARGRAFSEAHKEQLSLAKKGRSWWHKGKENMQSVECPGEGWERGRYIEVVEAKQWWNNGKEQTKAVSKPGEGWVEGKIGAFRIDLPDDEVISLIRKHSLGEIAKKYNVTKAMVRCFIKRFKRSRGLL